MQRYWQTARQTAFYCSEKVWRQKMLKKKSFPDNTVNTVSKRALSTANDKRSGWNVFYSHRWLSSSKQLFNTSAWCILVKMWESFKWPATLLPPKSTNKKRVHLVLAYDICQKEEGLTRSKKLRTTCLCFRLVSPSSVAVSMWHRRSGSLELSSRTSAGRISLHRSLMKSPTRTSFQNFST